MVGVRCEVAGGVAQAAEKEAASSASRDPGPRHPQVAHALLKAASGPTPSDEPWVELVR